MNERIEQLLSKVLKIKYNIESHYFLEMIRLKQKVRDFVLNKLGV